MKTLVKIAFVILVLISIVAIVASIYFYNAVNQKFQSDVPNFGGDPKYHFSLILTDTDSTYISQIKKGVYDAAAKYNVAIEFHESDFSKDGLLNSDYINIARLAKLDGVIVNSSNNEGANLITSINEAIASGMVVSVTGYKDIQSSRNVYVGTSQFSYGQKAAELVYEAGNGPNLIYPAIIFPSSYQDETDNNTNLFELGFKSMAKSFSERFQDFLYEKTNSKLLGAEDITLNILKENPEVNVIFCMNAKDTIAAAQAVVDRYRVGSVFIVGTDVNDEILDYIDKGIIYGVIDRNGYLIGQSSIEALINQIEGTMQSSYKDIDIKQVTKSNISDYLEQEN
ncbi:MAG: substrate-binding domain-containing protein [Clostridia bacterium]|nr:substrate-binding domain-containing protein [Clostridia bacterium]